MNDVCVKGRLDGLEIAFAFADTTEVVNELVLIHDCDPVAAHLFGRSITEAVLGASLLPDGQRLNTNWQYPGALKAIVIDAGHDASLRAIISPSHLQNITQSQNEIFGDIGEIKTVVMDEGKVLRSSATPVSLHDPVNDFAYHFSISDQIETSIKALIGFAPDEKNPIALSNGMMIQALPNCDLNTFENIRKKMENDSFANHLKIKDSQKILEVVINELVRHEDDYLSYTIGSKITPKFVCNCSSEEKFSVVLKSIPIPERMEIVKENNPLKINCEYCKKIHEVSIKECIKYWNN